MLLQLYIISHRNTILSLKPTPHITLKMSDSNCIICFEALSSQPLGVAVPCGHCFHQTCFEQWKASGRRQSVSCPMCNGRTITFCKLFLDLQEQQDSDGDFSLSSIETNDDSEPQKRASIDTADNDGAQADGSEQQVEGVQEEPANNEDSNAGSGPPDVIEIDDNSVVEILSNASPSRPPLRASSGSDQTQTRPRKRKKSLSQTSESDKNDDPARIRRKAKRLKKQNKFLESQRTEFVERERKLLDDFAKSRERLEQVETEQEAQQASFKSAQRELEGLRVKVARLSREKADAEGQREALSGLAERNQAKLEEMTSKYRLEIQNAQSKAMQEVKSITERQPLLIQENHELKAQMMKQEQQIKSMQKTLESLQDCVQERADKEMAKKRVSSKKQQKNMARAYQELQQERERQEEERIRSHKAKASRPSRTYSAQASRVSVATLKVAAKQKSVMDVLGGSMPRRKEGKRAAKVSKDTSRNEDGRMDSEDVDGGAIVGGMSLHVSSSKRRKIEPLPVGKTGATKAKKHARKEAKMFDYFGRNV